MALIFSFKLWASIKHGIPIFLKNSISFFSDVSDSLGTAVPIGITRPVEITKHDKPSKRGYRRKVIQFSEESVVWNEIGKDQNYVDVEKVRVENVITPSSSVDKAHKMMSENSFDSLTSKIKLNIIVINKKILEMPKVEAIMEKDRTKEMAKLKQE